MGTGLLLGHAVDLLLPGSAVGAVVLVGVAVWLIVEAGRDLQRGLIVTAIACLAFQGFHVLEHVLQAGAWLLRPDAAPWITPWAVPGRDLLASAADGRTGTGSELLHLLGNAIFLIGLVALALLARRRGLQSRALRIALGVQALHVAEHVVLTLTWATYAEANGLSTAFGLLEPGTIAGNAVRVWFHFLINLVGTLYAVAAVRDLGLWLPRRGLSQPSPPGASGDEGPEHVTPEDHGLLVIDDVTPTTVGADGPG